MQINLLPKKTWKQTLWKTINVVSSISLIFNMTMVGVFITPKVAEAAAVPNSATVNGGATATVAPSASITVALTVTASSGNSNRWRSSEYRIQGGSWTCVNTADHTSGTATESFTITAPASTGTYNLDLRAYSDNSCSSDQSSTLTLTGAIIVQTQSAVSNPALGQSCGLDIGLVVDTSGSINAADMSQLKTAMTNFANAFVGTPTVFSLTSFNTNSTLNRAFSLTPAQAASDISTDIPSAGSNETNWDSGLARSFDSFDPRPAKTNLIVIATDGSPNRFGYPTTDPSGLNYTTGISHAIDRANTIKTAGTRIVVVGIGNDTNDPATLAQKLQKMEDISGPNVATTPAAITPDTDVIKVTDFSGIGAALAAFSNQLCGGKILVQKQFDANGDGVAEIDGSTPNALLAGWNFDVNGSPSDPAAQTTTNTGSLQFDVQNGTYSVVETNLQSNTHLISAQCVKGTQPVGSVDLNTRTISGLTMDTDQTISCTFVNQPYNCNLQIDKRVNKADAAPGDTLTYTINYQNTGNAECTGGGVRIDDVIPTGTTYVASSNTQSVTHDTDGQGIDFGYTSGKFGADNPGFNGSMVSWNAHVVSPGESGTVSFQVTVNSIANCAQEDIKNTGKIYADQYPDGLTSNEVSTHVTAPCYGSLKVTKVVDSGSATPDQWHFTTNNQTLTPASGQNYVIFNNVAAGSYTVTESALAGYHQVSTTCNNVNVVPNQQATCTIHNAHDTGNLKINKAVDTDGDGQIDETNPAGWTYDIDSGNQNYAMGTTQSVLTGSHTVSEDQHANYSATGWTCDNGTSGTGESFSVNVTTAGVTCTFTNARDTGTLKVIKHVVGGTAQASDWTMNINNLYSFAGSETGVTKTLITGDYQVTETNGPANYTLTYSGDCDSSGHVTINKGDNKICTLTNTRDKGWLKVVKHVINDNGGNDTASSFTLHVKQGGNDVSGSPAAGSETGTLYNLDTGSYVVSENAHAGYTQTSIVCGGQNTDTANVTKTDSSTNPVVCTITNDDVAPTITLIKHVTNNNGGTAGVNDFGLTIGATGVNSGNTLNVNANTPIALNEAGKAGYSFVNITGDAKCPSVLGGTVTLNEGENVTCTINNDDIAPKLKLVKTVINDNGGTKVVADFPLFINGNQVTSGNWNEVVANVGYTATETSDPNYAASTWSGDCTAGGKITLQPGDQKICYITNNDIQPKLTVTKVVINNNGGTKVVADFPLFVNGNSVTSGVQNGFNAGNYTVSETNQPGYAATISGNCDSNGHISLSAGDVKSCTITNDDKAATLKVIKHVINDNGGNNVAANFTMNVTGNNVSNSSFAGNEAGVEVTLDAGSYSVGENGPSGYSANYSTDCSGTMSVGDYKTCTINNNDIAPTITLNKLVNNNHGGNAGVNNFGLTIGGTGVTSGQTLAVNANAPIALNEAGLTGYNFVSLTGDAKCPSVLGGTVTLNEGENITCTITNEDIAPTITLNKVVNNNHGGNAGVNDFGLTIGGTPVTSGQTLTVNSNTPIALNEAGKTGYNFVSITGDAKCPSVLGGNVTLNEGENITCTINNDDIAPKLKLVKTVINDNGGTKVVANFPLFINGNQVASGNWNEVMANTEHTVTETSDQNYAASTWSGDCTADGKITLQPGDEKTCYITNDDKPGTINGYKYDNHENKLDGWQICLSGGAVEDNVDVDFGNNCVITGSGSWPTGYYEFPGLNAGLYTLTETVKPGWAPVDPASGQYTDVPVLIGQTTNRDFVNRQIFPDMSVTKDDGVTTATPSQPLTYAMVVNNHGEYVANNVVVTDTLPAHATFVSADNGGTYNSGTNTVTWNLGNMAVNSPITLHMTIQLDAVFPFGNTNVTNSVTVSSDNEMPSTLSDNTATDTDTVSATPVLGLTKTAPAQVNAGDNITYTINWSIAGNAQATQVVLWDAIPANTTFVSADNSGVYDAATKTVTWTMGTKNPGDSGTVHMVVKTNSPLADGTIITNTANLDAAEIDPALHSTAQTKIVSVPILNITKLDTPDPVKPGNNINYTINWSITGNATAHNVKITDGIPTNTTYVSVADGGVYDVNTNTITWTLGTKNPGDSGSVHFIVKVNTPLTNGTVIKNTATIDSDETAPTSADATTTVVAAPVLKITKSVDKSFVNPGGNANYTVVIENTGNDAAINVKLNDLLPSGFTFTEFGTNTHTWSLGNIAAGAKISLTYNVTIGAGVAAGTYDNLAVASADNYGNVTAIAPLDVRVPTVLGEEALPNLVIEKTVNKAFANPGDTVVYTVKVTNKGDAVAVNTQLQDVMPAGFTFDDKTITKTWKLGDILPGETKTVSYNAHLDKKILPGKYENLAIAWADNNDKVSDFVSLDVRAIKVLGLPVTGPSGIQYLYLLAAGLIMGFSLYMFRLTSKKEE